MIDPGYRIKMPVFGSYEDLEEILKVSFGMYEAIKISWKWVYTEENVGELLYNFLDDEENGFTLYQEMEEDPKKISEWNCIIDAIAYISRAAYEKEGINYLPESIEIVDDNILIHMIQSIFLCNNNEHEYVEKLCLDIKNESMKN